MRPAGHRGRTPWPGGPVGDGTDSVRTRRRPARRALGPAEAARLEVEWWRVHPEHSSGPAADASPLVGGLVATLSNVYRVPAAEVGPAAWLRAEAMDPSDRSAPSGRGGDQPPEIARTLVGCYTSLPDTVDR